MQGEIDILKGNTIMLPFSRFSYDTFTVAFCWKEAQWGEPDLKNTLMFFTCRFV